LAAVFAEPRQAAALMPGDARYQSLAGDAAAQAGQFEEAIAYYRAAVRNDPYRPSYHWRLARALMAAGQAEEALAELRQAAALNPTHTGYRAELAQAEEKR
jgi:predicted Zn-dependent protease